MWVRVKLKMDEANYFLEQMNCHTRHPRIFLFYLSAFLSSARSITWHLKKAFSGKDPSAIYEKLRVELLTDSTCKYFVTLRNYTEKEGYAPLGIDFLVGYARKPKGSIEWHLRAGGSVFGKRSNTDFKFIENLLRQEWDMASMSYGVPAKIKLEWYFPDYVKGKTYVITACREYSDRLWYFLAQYRAIWEPANDPEAIDRKIDIFLDGLLFE